MVCGDKALGYNFNAVTCESCKAFFRRNALSSKDFSCPFNETCEITVVTRRFCQRCRLQKCFKIGMRKEYIMTEEDKLLKRKKVEQNRAKRKSKASTSDGDENRVKKEPDHSMNEFWPHDHLMDTSPMEMSPGSSTSECLSGFQSIPSIMSNNSMSPTSPSSYSTASILPPQSSPLQMSYAGVETTIAVSTSITNTPPIITNAITSTTNNYQMNFPPTQRIEYPTKDSSPSDIVNFFLNHPNESTNYINHLMSNQKSAMEVITKIIQSQKDAMRMIGHMIGCPGDALKIISKIMNSPYHALTVFTKFMASPTDALEIIAKCVNSPSDVLQFIQQLMSTPDNAVEIVNKFMNSPGEAMKMLNDMVDITMVDSTTKAMESSYLSNLMGSPSESTTSEVRPTELTSNDTVTDTLFHTKTMSSPTVRNLLQSNHGESFRQKTTAATEQCEKDSEEMGNLQPNTLEAIISDAIRIEYNWNGKESSTNRELNDSETAKLNELIVAYKALFVPLDEDITPLVRERHDSSSNKVIFYISSTKAINENH